MRRACGPIGMRCARSKTLMDEPGWINRALIDPIHSLTRQFGGYLGVRAAGSRGRRFDALDVCRGLAVHRVVQIQHELHVEPQIGTRSEVAR